MERKIMIISSALVAAIIITIIVANVVYAFMIVAGRAPVEEQPIRYESSIYQTGGF